MATELVHVGFGNFLAINRIIAVFSPNSAPTKRLIAEAKNKGQLINLTSGRRTKATLLMDTGHVILTGIGSETIADRVATTGSKLETKERKGKKSEQE
jgi:hypothetical protein